MAKSISVMFCIGWIHGRRKKILISSVRRYHRLSLFSPPRVSVFPHAEKAAAAADE